MRILLVILTLFSLSFQLSAESYGSMLRRGDAMLKAGDYNGAASLYSAILDSPVKQQSIRMLAANGLAVVYRNRGEWQKSVGAYEQALGAALSGGASREDADNLRFNLSQFCLELGQYKKAADLILSAAFEPATEVSARAVALLAAIESRRGNSPRAIELIDSIKGEFPDGDINRAILIQNRGYINWDMGNHEEASADLSDALSAFEGDRYHNTLANLSLVESASGKFNDALGHIDTAISYFSHRTDVAGHADYVSALRKKAEILAMAGRKKESAAAFKKYFDNERRRVAEALPKMSPQMRLDYWQMEKPLLSRCFALGDADPRFLLDVAMFRRAVSLLGMRDTVALIRQLRYDSRTLSRALSHDEAAMEIVSYEPVRDSLCYAALVLSRKGGAKFVPLFSNEFVYKAETVGRNSLYNAVTGENREDKNTLYADTVLANRIWQPVIDALPGGVNRLYFAAEGIFHLFAIENMPFARRDSMELHRVSSLASVIDRSKGHEVSSSALVIGGLDYDEVPEDISVSDTLPTVSHAAFDELLVGLGAQRSPGGLRIFSYLPGTRLEADSVGRALGARVYHTMSEECLKELLPRYSTVHIATHGYSLGASVGRRPEFLADSVPVDRSLLLSGIALSGANVMHGDALREDAVLSAREICELDLSGVDCVVLSACQTAKGDIFDEGASGLIRGLKMAGVKTIIASLWSVDDASTSLFMKEFYKGIASGMSRHDAFTAARRKVSDETSVIAYRKFSPRRLARSKSLAYREIPPFSDPYYWAPFIIIDDF